MNTNRKLCILAAVLAVAVFGFIACSGDDNGQTGPSPITYSAPQPSDLGSTSGSSGNGTSGTTSGGNTPAGDLFTIMDGAQVSRWTDCRTMPKGWFLPDGADIKIRINRDLDDEYDLTSNLFYRKAIGCSPFNDNPGRSSSIVRDGKFIDASFRPEKACGSYQWDINVRNRRTGEEKKIYFVLDTGNETCAPPPPPPPTGCPDGQVRDTQDGKCYPVCNIEQESVNFRGLGIAQNEVPACRCPNGDVPGEFGCRAPECDDFQAPGITFDPDVQMNDTKVRVNSLNASPSGGTASPTPPQVKNRPAYGESADSIDFDYVLDYSPYEGLECRTSDSLSVPVPPQEPSCEEVNKPDFNGLTINAPLSVGEECETVAWHYKLTGGSPGTRKLRCEFIGGSYESTASIPGDGVVDACVFDHDLQSDDFQIGISNPKTRFRLYHEEEGNCRPVYKRSNPITCSVNVMNAGNWKLIMKATNPGNYTKDTDSKTLECGGQTQLFVTYNWKDHDSRDWQCFLTRDGNPVDDTEIIDGH